MFIPYYIDKIYNILNANSIESFVVGGCVRDAMLKKIPYDYDMCASAKPEELIAVLKDFQVIPTGIRHGTIAVISDNHPVEITSYRLETGYSDFRHPDSVLYTKNIEEDLARRDFTINAMAYNKNRGFIDLYGGKKDIENKIIKTVGDPEKRFSEDSLRILRALRFSSHLEFTIDENTSEQMIKKAYLLENIAIERTLVEIRKMIMGSCDCFFRYKNILKNYFSNYTENDIFLAKKTENEILRFSFLYDNLDKNGLSEYIRKMRFPRNISDKLIFLKNYEDYRIENREEIRKMISQNGVENTHLFLQKQDIKSSQNGEILKIFEDIIGNENECFSLKQLAVNGNDIKNMGIDGRKIGIVLSELLNMVMSGKCRNNREELLEIAKSRYL
jgi:tRNA nucleotidyltransferase (CCA-adding enzyme)